MKILSIETSCDETSAAVTENGRKLLSVVTASQVDEHRLYGGVVPEIASRRHVEAITQVCDTALSEANVALAGVDAIAVTVGPGLIGALLVGVNFAKGVSTSTGLPLIPVHHVKAHVAANYLAHPDLTPPFLCLTASGGHTLVLNVSTYTDLQLIGTTIDDAAGEAFDKAARAMGFPYPGGVFIDSAAKDGDPDKYKLPIPHTSGEFDFSFSGLKTAVLNTINTAKQRGDTLDVPSLAASFRKTAVASLTAKLLEAARKLGSTTIVLSGGVAANELLRSKLSAECGSRGYRLYYPPLSLCGDNAAMVGAAGYFEYLAGNIGGANTDAFAELAI
ncbi:MAG: tRNA (adenosine(37)-N6)-threonylcarbamoyltransferase complex transferase subunit TsaD [Oscillospiraceae bacterium]|jgi:N6-L-threonylcarbamoyladenine synthase|nr:tRNA (adenosine(37)-N6)-threonylcarbamoyltransferase complex transferase subunit TsaD [Oscillospiraceae bacterium]